MKKNIPGSNGEIKSYGPFDPLLKFGRPKLLITEKRFHSYLEENHIWKLV
jgi:hypothetical protein